ncbi:MAG TPA: DUF971 domain-containing protein [Anaerolineales bacterium]|nr:DUF971 domain-containing protein [Anaerolineales bacterium]
MTDYKPLDIKVYKERLEMVVKWDDGHESVYPFSLLRAGCPCALCRGGHENMSSTPSPEIFNFILSDTEETRIATVVPTGSYGITIVWEDGHDYGIYKWNYLRALCPCIYCRA